MYKLNSHEIYVNFRRTIFLHY